MCSIPPAQEDLTSCRQDTARGDRSQLPNRQWGTTGNGEQLWWNAQKRHPAKDLSVPSSVVAWKAG